MQTIRIAFGTDRYQNLEQDIVSLINESFGRKGFEVFWFDFNKVRSKGGEVQLPLRRFRRRVRKLTKSRMLSHDPAEDTDASLVDVVVIKKDPPQSHRILKLLAKARRKTLVINDPHGIVKYESKTYLKKFRKLTVPTYFSSSIRDLERAVRRLGNCVLKEDVGFGGKGVHHVFVKDGKYYAETNRTRRPGKIDLRSLLRKLTHGGKREVLVVKYLKRVSHGDKRILLFDNRILGAILRMPGHKDGWVCNLSSGGYMKKTRLTKEEKVIVESVKKTLNKDGVYMMGIDTLEDDDGKRVLSEANTTNPAGVSFIDRLYNRNASKFVVDWIEKKARKASALRGSSRR